MPATNRAGARFGGKEEGGCDHSRSIDNNTFTTMGGPISIYISSGGVDTYAPTIDTNHFTGCADPAYFQISTDAAGTVAGEVVGNDSTGTTGTDVRFSVEPNDTTGLEITTAIHDNTFSAADGADNVEVGGNGWAVAGNVTVSPTISNNTISSSARMGIGISLSSMSFSGSGPLSLTVVGNTITGAGFEGIYIKISSWYSEAAVDQRILVQGNTVTGTEEDGIYLTLAGQSGLASNDIRITDNIVTGSGQNGLLFGSSDWSLSPSNPAHENAALVSCNTVTGNQFGIQQVLQNDPPADYGGGNLASPGNNVLMSNWSYDFVDYDDADVKAENNWWGTTDLPTIANHVSDHADDPSKGVVDYETPLGAAPTVTLAADLADAVVVDVGPAGPSVGDTFEYTATITPGAGSCGDTGLTFTVPVPANTTLVPDSITTTSGSVTGTSPITVTTGSVSAGETITVTWRVVVNSGTQVSSQGTLAATRSGSTLSNDPATAPPEDPTVTVFQQEREAVPTLGEWGLIALTGLLLLLGVAFLRRRRLAAAGLVLLLAVGAGWAGAATHRKADRSGKEGKTTTVATVKSTNVFGNLVTLALSDGTTLTMPKHALKVRQHRDNPERARLQGLRPEDRLIEQSKIRAARQAQRTARQAELQAMSPEQRAAQRTARRIEAQRAQRARASEQAAPVALLAKGTPVLVTFDRDAHGRIQRARVETYASEPEASLALQSRQEHKRKTAVR